MVRDELRHAIWLEPDPASIAVCAGHMHRLRASFGGPEFVPHITLTSGLQGGASDLVARCRDLLSVPLAGAWAGGPIALRGDYFLAVTVPLRPPAAAAALRQRLRRACGLDPAMPWQPHLSLLYGEFAPPVAERLRLACAGIVLPAVHLGAASLWRLQGPVSEWTCVERWIWHG